MRFTCSWDVRRAARTAASDSDIIFLKGGIGLDLIEAFFHIGKNLNCFTDDQTAIAGSIGSEFFKEFVGVFVENKLTAHGWPLESG